MTFGFIIIIPFLSLFLTRLAAGWTVRGSNPGGGRDFPHPSRPTLGPPSLLYNGYRVFPGGKAAGAWSWPPTPFYLRGWRKSTAIHLLPLWALVACSRVTFTFYVYIYLCVRACVCVFTTLSVSQIIYRRKVGWNGREKIWKEAVPALLEGSGEIQKSLRIFDVLAEIRPGHLPNAASKRYRQSKFTYFKWLKKGPLNSHLTLYTIRKSALTKEWRK